MPLSTAELQTLSRLLDVGLALPESEREAWLAALPEPDCVLAGRLRRLLAEQARPSPGRLLDEPPPLEPLAWAGQAGERCGPYRLLARLGRGGMGEVWRAERVDGAFERVVALKLPRLPLSLGLGQDLAERLRNECRMLARLEHPHIARLYDGGIDEAGRPWVASELVEGPGLDAALGGRSQVERLMLLVAVVRAVDYAHRRGVLHCDLKPGNVMVAQDGEPRLVDFGIGALLDQPASATPRALTPRYAAPELHAGGADSVQADVHALGVMAEEMLAGVPPDRSLRQADLRAVLAKARSAEPAQRYASAALFATELLACLRGEPVQARPLGALTRGSRWMRRHWLAGGAVGALGMALAVGGVALWQAREVQRLDERERLVRGFAAELFRLPVGARADGSSPLLEVGAQLIATRFEGDLALQADLYAAVSQAYSDMGAHRLALEHRERQLTALQAMPASAEGAAGRRQAEIELAETYWQLGDPEAALQRLKDLRDPAAGTAQALSAELLAARALVDLGRFDEVAGLLTALERRLPPQAVSLDRAWLEAVRAEVTLRDGRLDEGFQALDAAAAMARRVEGAESVQAALMQLRGIYPAGMAERRELTERWVAEATRALRARGGPWRIRAVLEQARMWRALATTQQAVLREEAIAGLQACMQELLSLGPAVPPLVMAEVEGRLGDLRFDFGDLGGAALIEAHYPLRLAAARRPMEGVALHGVAAAAAAEVGRYEEALQRSRARHQARLDAGRAKHPNVAVDLRQQALIHLMAGQADAALAVLDSAPPAAGMSVVTGLEPPWYENLLREARARVLLDAGRPSEALAVLPDRGALPQDFVLVGILTAPGAVRGEALCQQGRSREGWPLLREHVARLNPNRHPHAAQVARLKGVAALCARAAGRLDEARALAADARRSFAARPEAADYFKLPLKRFDS